MITTRLYILLTLFTCCVEVMAQKNNNLLEVYFAEVRSNEFPIIPKELTIAENARNTLEQIKPYLDDSLVNVRAKAYTIINLTGTRARRTDIREEAVLKLIACAKDNDSGNAGLALDYLANFRSTDFNPVAKDSLGNLFQYRAYHYDKVLKLAGFVGLTDLIEQIRSLTRPGNPQQIRWAAMLALARMSDPSSITNMMTRLKRLPINDDIIYQVFPDLVYTKNLEAFNYMIEALKSDAKNCLSADAETPIPCGYRIMELLAGAIRNYPLALDQSGDIRSDDYLASLAAVRYWFNENKNYEIITDRY